MNHERAQGAPIQDQYNQTELSELIGTFNFGNNEYILDISPEGKVKMSKYQKWPIGGQSEFTQEELSQFLQHLDMVKGQYHISKTKEGKLRFVRIQRRWIQRDDFKGN